MHKGGSIHSEHRKIKAHQEILLRKKVRNWNTPKGREGVRGTEATSWPQPYGTSRRLGNPRFPLHKGGTIFSDAVFRKILSIGFEFETHDLAKLSLHKNNRYLINSDTTLRMLKEKKEVGTIKEVDANYLSVRVHLGHEAAEPPPEEPVNLDELDADEREFMLAFQDEIAQEKLERYENDSFLEYFNESRPHDDTKRIKFQVTNDIGDVEFNYMLNDKCKHLTIAKDQMYAFKTKSGKLFKIRFMEALKKYCGTLSGVEYVVTYYEPKKRENPDIIVEHFVDACSRIVDHLGDLKHTSGTLFLQGDDAKTHYEVVGNIEGSRRLYRKPGTNLFYLETYDGPDTVQRKSLGSFEFIPQMTFRCKAEDGVDIMKAIVMPDASLKKDRYIMEQIEGEYEETKNVEAIVDALFAGYNAATEHKILTTSRWFKPLKTYVFLIYYKLFAFIKNHNEIDTAKENYLKDQLVFASRHSNHEMYERVKEILKEHYHISDIDHIRALFWRPDVLEKIYEYVEFAEEDFDAEGEYKYGDASHVDLPPSDKNYGNPLFSILSYFKYFENPTKVENDWLVESGIDAFSTRFELKGDEILLENRLFKDEIALLLHNKIDLKIKDGLLTVDGMRSLVKKLYGSKNLKHMLTAKRSHSKHNVSKNRTQAIIAEVLKKSAAKSKKSVRMKTPSHLKRQKRVSAKKRLSVVAEVEGDGA